MLFINILTPEVIYFMAGLGTISYLLAFWFQKRFSQTNLPDLISTGFQVVSIISGCKLVILVFVDFCRPGAMMEMDKFYTDAAVQRFYGFHLRH